MKVVELKTGGRIKYSNLDRANLWTKEKDILLFQEMAKPNKSLIEKAKIVQYKFNNKMWGIKNIFTISNRYYLIKKAIKDTITPREL